MKYTLFISDLHLSVDHPELTAALIKLGETLAANASALYILGDFFALWAGDDDESKFNAEVIAILKKITQKIPIYLMPGNRDFLLGKRFAATSNCTLLPDPTKIYLHGRPTLLSHGDMLCTNDLIAVIFRHVSQNKLGKKLFLRLPLKFRTKLAMAIHKHSTHKNKTKTGAMMDVNQKKIEKVMRKYAVSQLIHGHTHKPNHYAFMLQDQTMRRIVLPNWETVPQAVVYYENGNWEAKRLD